MDFFSLTSWRNIYAKGGRIFGLGCALVFILPIVLTAGSFLTQRRPQEQQTTGTLATVNGDPITDRDLTWVPAESRGGTPGAQHAAAYGRVIYSLVVHKIVEQMAHKAGAKPTDADIDRAVAKGRESQVGANATDSDWESYLYERRHLSPAEYRDHVAEESVGEALLNKYKAAETVTLDDAKNQYSEVQLSVVFVAATGPTSSFKGQPKTLTDADAKKKADDLYAKVKAGADIKALAKVNADVFSATAKTTGVSDWKKENQESQMGSLNYGEDFDKAVRTTAKGDLTPVVKTTGFEAGYIFARVQDRRVKTPEKYDAKKEVDDLKAQRAMKKLDAAVKAAYKSAKVAFPKEQVEIETYYNYAKLQMMQAEMGGMFAAPSADAPTKAEVDAQQAIVDAGWEKDLAAHPDDTTAMLMVADSLQKKLLTATGADTAKLRDRLITLYEGAFKSTEDTALRFTLAGLYKDKLDYKSAFKQYATVDKQLNSDPPYDLASRQKQLTTRTQIETGLNGLPAGSVPDAADLIASQKSKIMDLTAKIEIDRQKEIEQRKAQDEAAKKANAIQLGAKSLASPGGAPPKGPIPTTAGSTTTPPGKAPAPGKSVPGPASSATAHSAPPKQ